MEKEILVTASIGLWTKSGHYFIQIICDNEELGRHDYNFMITKSESEILSKERNLEITQE